jgi:hypothetical protein
LEIAYLYVSQLLLHRLPATEAHFDDEIRTILTPALALLSAHLSISLLCRKKSEDPRHCASHVLGKVRLCKQSNPPSIGLFEHPDIPYAKSSLTQHMAITFVWYILARSS